MTKRQGTIALSWGPWGGFYLNRGFCKRICAGWLALTYIRVELDDMMEAYARELERPREVSASGYTCGGVPAP